MAMHLAGRKPRPQFEQIPVAVVRSITKPDAPLTEKTLGPPANRNRKAAPTASGRRRGGIGKRS